MCRREVVLDASCGRAGPSKRVETRTRARRFALATPGFDTLPASRHKGPRSIRNLIGQSMRFLNKPPCAESAP